MTEAYLDRHSVVKTTLNELITELYQYTGDVYYQAQDAESEGLSPEDLKATYDWADKVTQFYRQCLQMQSAFQ